MCETTVAQQSDLELRFEGGKCWARGTGLTERIMGEVERQRQAMERERDKASGRKEDGKDPPRLFQETITILHYEWGEIYLSPALRSGRRAGRGTSLNATSEVCLCKLLPKEGVEWQLDVTLSLAYPGSSPGPAQWVRYSLCHRDCVTHHGWPFAFSRYLVATVNYNFPFAASPAESPGCCFSNKSNGLWN